MPDLFAVHTGPAVSITASEADPKVIVNTGGTRCHYGPGHAVGENRWLEGNHADVSELAPGEQVKVTAPTFFSISDLHAGTSLMAIERKPKAKRV